MTIAYDWNINPFQDFLMNLMDSGLDISDRKIKKDINSVFQNILENFLENPDDIVHLDFEIKNSNEGYVLIGKNFISSLWFSGVFIDADEVNDINEYKYGHTKFKYNNKTNKLKVYYKFYEK